MELVSLGLEAVQSVAEHAASYRFGQSLLRQLDRTLWVIEKCARWAVPPPLEADERPPPALVRPLPWPLFLMMLVTLRVTRESISLANLLMGKPPLRSADVVVFIQGKRRYLRTLKYQGNRMMRARTSAQAQQPWYRSLQSLFQLTMCFRRESHNYGNNNTTRATNNDEVVVIKSNNPGRQESPAVTSGETTMERLIEKMMVDLDAESDEDNNVAVAKDTAKIEISECTESDQDAMSQISTPTPAKETEISQTNGDDIHFSPKKNKNSSSTPEKSVGSTPEKHDRNVNSTPENHNVSNNHTDENNTSNETFQHSYVETDSDKTITESSPKNNEEKRKLEQNITETAFAGNSYQNNTNLCDDSALPPSPEEGVLSPSQASENFIKNESANSRRPTKKDHKIANGRTVKSVPSKKKGMNHHQRGNSNDAPQRVPPSNPSF